MSGGILVEREKLHGVFNKDTSANDVFNNSFGNDDDYEDYKTFRSYLGVVLNKRTPSTTRKSRRDLYSPLKSQALSKFSKNYDRSSSFDRSLSYQDYKKNSNLSRAMSLQALSPKFEVSLKPLNSSVLNLNNLSSNNLTKTFETYPSSHNFSNHRIDTQVFLPSKEIVEYKKKSPENININIYLQCPGKEEEKSFTSLKKSWEGFTPSKRFTSRSSSFSYKPHRVSPSPQRFLTSSSSISDIDSSNRLVKRHLSEAPSFSLVPRISSFSFSPTRLTPKLPSFSHTGNSSDYLSFKKTFDRPPLPKHVSSIKSDLSSIESRCSRFRDLRPPTSLTTRKYSLSPSFFRKNEEDFDFKRRLSTRDEEDRLWKKNGEIIRKQHQASYPSYLYNNTFTSNFPTMTPFSTLKSSSDSGFYFHHPLPTPHMNFTTDLKHQHRYHPLEAYSRYYRAPASASQPPPEPSSTFHHITSLPPLPPSNQITYFSQPQIDSKPPPFLHSALPKSPSSHFISFPISNLRTQNQTIPINHKESFHLQTVENLLPEFERSSRASRVSRKNVTLERNDYPNLSPLRLHSSHIREPSNQLDYNYKVSRNIESEDDEVFLPDTPKRQSMYEEKLRKYKENFMTNFSHSFQPQQSYVQERKVKMESVRAPPQMHTEELLHKSFIVDIHRNDGGRMDNQGNFVNFPRNSNKVYEDAHFYDNQQYSNQQIITPPTKVTKPEIYIRRDPESSVFVSQHEVDGVQGWRHF